MRISKAAGSGITKASRAGRGRKKKLSEAQKKALGYFKLAKKSLSKLKAEAKVFAKQYAANLAKAEESLQRVEELGGEVPYMLSSEWDEVLTDEIEGVILPLYSDIETLESELKRLFR